MSTSDHSTTSPIICDKTCHNDPADKQQNPPVQTFQQPTAAQLYACLKPAIDAARADLRQRDSRHERIARALAGYTVQPRTIGSVTCQRVIGGAL